MSDTTTTVSQNDEVVSVDTFHWSDLIKQEDWLAVWIGFIVIIIGAISVLTGTQADGKWIPSFTFKAINFSKWGPGASSSLGAQLSQASFWFGLIRTFLVTGVLFSLGAKYGNFCLWYICRNRIWRGFTRKKDGFISRSLNFNHFHSFDDGL